MFVFIRDRCFVTTFQAAIAGCILGFILTAANADEESGVSETFKTYVGMFNELSERRRRVVYTPYPTSPKFGVLHNFVHVGSGAAAFARIDLVIDAPMPIIVRRAYNSNRTDEGILGKWRLASYYSRNDCQAKRWHFFCMSTAMAAK